MRKKTLCTLLAGFIAALGITGLFTVSNKNTANSSKSRTFSGLDKGNGGGWYTNKAQRGMATRKRIYKYIS